MTLPRTKWLIVTVLIVGFGILQYLNFTGFCYRQSRYYTDRELIDGAFKYGETHFGDQHPIKYASLNELLDANPNCCRVDRWSNSMLLDGIWPRFFGWYIAVVELDYKIRNQPPNNYFSASAPTTACAAVADFSSSNHTRN